MHVKEGEAMDLVRAHVLVCGGTGCTSSGSDKVQEACRLNW